MPGSSDADGRLPDPNGRAYPTRIGAASTTAEALQSRVEVTSKM